MSQDAIWDDISEVSDVSNVVITNLDNINVIIDKNNLDMHIQNKIEKLDERLRYVDYKFEDLRQSFKKYSISIIYLATFLTLMEAFTNSIDLEIINNAVLIKFIKFIPLILSSFVSLLAALIKFNKYEEKIEKITRATEKCITTLAKLKGVKEDLYFCNESSKIKKVSDYYRKTVYKEYLDSNTSIEKQLVDTDYAKYMKKLANNDVKRKKIESNKKKQLELIKNNQNNPAHDISQVQLNILELEDCVCMKKYSCCLFGCKK